MKTGSLRALLALALGIAVSADAAVLATLRKEAPAYPNATRRVFEKPTFHTSKGEVVEIVRWGAPLAQVRTRSGRLGWVESGVLDTVNIPAILSIAPPPAKPATVTAADDSAVAKRWMDAQKARSGATGAAEKPLDFPKDSAHITPRAQQDSVSR